MKKINIKRDQLRKICHIAIAAVAFMLVFDILFLPSLPIAGSIENWIHSLEGNMVWLWAGIWFIMWLQVAVVPIPGAIILNTAISVGLFKTRSAGMITDPDFWIFIAVTISAYMVGAMTAYWLGRRFGKKAIRWCAGSDEDYQKWSSLVGEKGRWYYAATIMLPVFPDDLLCMVVGSMKMRVGFFFWSNLIGRTVGLVAMMMTLGVVNGAGESSSIPWSSILWGVILVALIVADYLLRPKRIDTRN